MHKKLKFQFILLIALFAFSNGKAQFRISSYIDIGSNNVSDGIFLDAAGLASYQFGKNQFDAGFQLNLLQIENPFFSGTNFKYGREIQIKEFSFEIQALFMLNRFSEFMYEYDWGVLFKTEQKHFKYLFGPSFRTYAITHNGIDTYEIDPSNNLHENWNFMYLIAYNLKEVESDWNVGLTLTNIDYFIINQETNPIFNVHGSYKLSQPITLFAEAWYKSAGAFNLSVNYFGFFFRTGIIWKLDI